MEKREQRVRRDRRRDGKRNTFQNEQPRETVKQQDSSIEEKKNDAQNVEVSNKKNTAEDKAIEDDPLRFANLKRETDEIAALKAKKPHKRQVFSNWSKYEEPLPSLDESRAVDFETLLNAPQSGGFRFKSEQQWDTGSYGRFGELFTPDAELLVGGLSSLPFYLRLGIDKSLFLEDEIERMDTCAKENYVAYEKLSKSKPKRKVAATDLFKIEQAEKYSVTDQLNGPTVELGRSSNKPVFSVEEDPEATPPEPSLPVRAAGNIVKQSDRSRENTPVTDRGPEGVVQDLHFKKPPPSSFGVADNVHSRTPDRDSTPLRDAGQRVSSPEFHFEKAPPPSFAYNNVKSPFHSRESTPAKEEMAPVTVSRGPISVGSSSRQVASREGTPDTAVPPVQKREAKQNVRDDRPTVEGGTFTAGVPSENVSLSKGTLGGEREDDSALRENSPARKVTYEHPPVPSVTSLEEKRSLDKIPGRVEMTDREEIPLERAPQEEAADVQDEPAYRKSPNGSDTFSGQKLDENGQISIENDNNSKKRGKPDVRKQEGQQKGGGRHGRRKKGQNAQARSGDQSRTEGGDVCDDTAEQVVEGTVPTASKGKETEREEPCRADNAKKKPERPPPPAVLQQNRQLSSPPIPQPTSAPPVIQRAETEVKQPLAPKPEETKVQQVSKPVKPPEEPKIQQVSKPVMPPEETEVQQVSKPVTTPDSQAQPPQRKVEVGSKVDPIAKGRSSAGRVDDDGLSFLMSLRGQKTGGVSEVEAAKAAAGAAVSRSAIEEDEMKDSQKPKPPPVIATEKKEDLEDWLDSMLDD